MKNKILLYILSVLGFIAFSCNDDIVVDKSGSESGESDGLTLSLKVDVPQMRTRAIDMTPGGALYLNNLWVGVYKKDGTRVLADQVDLHSRLTESGVTLTDVIKINVNGADIASGDDYCVVGVANYDGIKTDEGVLLLNALNAATNWKDFIYISLDAQQDIPNQTPVLMGYLTNSSDETKHTVVNQFNNGDDVDVANQTNVYVNGNDTGTGFVTNGYVMNLRRLRSKINIRINETPVSGITVTNIEYKVCNQPSSSFLAERKTNGLPSISNTSESPYSPNSPDVKKEKFIELKKKGYIDSDWQKPTDNYNFSFEHVENKHWAWNNSEIGSDKDYNTSSDDEKNIKRYHEREEVNGNGAFTALVGEYGVKEHWNNNASYFILKMNIKDEKNGRNGEIEYIIHEGFCNNADGESQVNDEGESSGAYENRLKDFSCFRNMDYYYNIQINSINDIVVSVTDSRNNKHQYDQSGSVWEIDYVKESDNGNNWIVTDGYDYQNGKPLDKYINGKSIDPIIKLSDVPVEEIAFRLVGTLFDADKNPKDVDVCFNFAHGDLNGFSGLWKDPSNDFTEYFVNPKENSGDKTQAITNFSDFAIADTENARNFRELANKIKIKTATSNGYITITEYIENLYNTDNLIYGENITDFYLEGYKFYHLSDGTERDYLRAFYIFDRRKALTDGSEVQNDNWFHNGDKELACNWYYKISGIEQYASYLDTEEFKKKYAYVINRMEDHIVNYQGGTSTYIDNDESFYNGTGMIFSNNPDIAFRILGYEGDKYYDYCCNFDVNDYPQLDVKNYPQLDVNDYPQLKENLWPEYTVDTKYITKEQLSTLTAQIPNLLTDLKLSYNNKSYTVDEFVNLADNGNLKSPYDVKFVLSEYLINSKEIITQNPDKYKRALYIFDKRKGLLDKPVLLSDDGKTATYHLYAVEQYPKYTKPQHLQLPNSNLISYKHSAEYDFVEENVGKLTIPLVNGNGDYGSDYFYRLTIGGKIYDLKIDGNNSKTTLEGNNVIFKVPRNAVSINNNSNFNPNTVNLSAIANSEKYLDSQGSRDVSFNVSGLKNQKTWDFRDNYWSSVFNSWTENSGGYYISSNVEQTIDYLTFSGNQKFRGYKNRYLYFNGIGTGTSLKITVYKDCKITVNFETVTLSSDDDPSKEYSIIIEGGAPSSFPSRSNHEVESQVKLEGEESKTITIYFENKKSNVFWIQLDPI